LTCVSKKWCCIHNMESFSVLERVLVRYGVLQSVTVCCSVLQCIAVYCMVLQCPFLFENVSQCVAVCCSVLQCAAVYCSVLQYIKVYCRVLQRTEEESSAHDCVLLSHFKRVTCISKIETAFCNILIEGMLHCVVVVVA